MASVSFCPSMSCVPVAHTDTHTHKPEALNRIIECTLIDYRIHSNQVRAFTRTHTHAHAQTHKQTQTERMFPPTCNFSGPQYSATPSRAQLSARCSRHHELPSPFSFGSINVKIFIFQTQNFHSETLTSRF